MSKLPRKQRIQLEERVASMRESSRKLYTEMQRSISNLQRIPSSSIGMSKWISTPSQAPYVVQISDHGFIPSCIMVRLNSTVEWIPKDVTIPYRIGLYEGNTKVAESADLDGDSIFQYVFTKNVNVVAVNEYNRQMKIVVVVGNELETLQFGDMIRIGCRPDRILVHDNDGNVAERSGFLLEQEAVNDLVVTSYPNRLYILSASVCTINRGGVLTVTIDSEEVDCEALPFVLLSEEEKRSFDVKPGVNQVLEMNRQGSYLLEDVLHHRRFSFRVREPRRIVDHTNSKPTPEVVSKAGASNEEAAVKDVPDLVSLQTLPLQPIVSEEGSASSNHYYEGDVTPISNQLKQSSSQSTEQQIQSKREEEKKIDKEVHIEPIENLDALSANDRIAFVKRDT